MSLEKELGIIRKLKREGYDDEIVLETCKDEFYGFDSTRVRDALNMYKQKLVTETRDKNFAKKPAYKLRLEDLALGQGIEDYESRCAKEEDSLGNSVQLAEKINFRFALLILYNFCFVLSSMIGAQVCYKYLEYLLQK